MPVTGSLVCPAYMLTKMFSRFVTFIEYATSSIFSYVVVSAVIVQPYLAGKIPLQPTIMINLPVSGAVKDTDVSVMPKPK